MSDFTNGWMAFWHELLTSPASWRWMGFWSAFCLAGLIVQALSRLIQWAFVGKP